MGAKSVIVLGGGPGGYVAAIRAAQLGAAVTLIEKQYLGGTCLNVGCIPTKCLLHSAELLESLKRQGRETGVEADNIRVNFPQVMAHSKAVSKRLTAGVRSLLRANGVAQMDGEGVFIGPKLLEVTKPDGTTEQATAGAIIVAAGSVNAVPRIPGVEGNPACLDSTGALALETLPASMVVVGGGVIGVEFACAYAAFGTKVTIVEAAGAMLPVLEPELTAVGMRHMKKMGISIHLNCPVQAVEESLTGAKVICRDKSGEPVSFEAEKVLIAAGRKANTARLGLAAGGLAHQNGSILVNDRMETNVPGVYAVGDCVAGCAQLAHTASVMGEIAAENCMGLPAAYDERACPTCVYMEPEAASVGLTEEQCRRDNLAYKTGSFPMAGNGKALILNGGEGLVKIVADARSGAVLGMHVIGPHASDLIGEGALAIRTGASLETLITTIHSHPTVTEAIREAALRAEGRALHIPPPRR